MKFLFALLVVGVGAKTLWHQLDDYTFEEYLKEYNKFYPEGDVYEYRKGLFLKKLAAVRKHNAEDHSWKNGINKFSDRTHEEFKAMATGRTHTPLPSVSLEDLNRKYGADPPATIDWRTKNAVTKVKNQGGCGSCWAFAGTETIESHVAISTGKLLMLSEQNVVDCTQNPRHCGGTGGCEGATAELAIDYVKQKGIALEADYPYRARDGKCDESKSKAAHTGPFIKLKENDHDDLYNAIGTVGPMAISVCADFADYELGLFRGCQKSCTIDHGVQAVGYGSSGGKDYWIVRNSWGANWGDHGYINLQRFGTSDAYCGMDNNAHDGTACDGDPDKVKICGMCGILYDSCYPSNATLA